MNVLARLIAEHIEREEAKSQRRRLAIKAAGVGALLAAIEARDGYAGDHSKGVVALSVRVAAARAVRGRGGRCRAGRTPTRGREDRYCRFDIEQAESARRGEWEHMRQHPAIGERIVASSEGLAHLAPVIRAEHECWDGKGYPDGLKGEEIPLAGRIVFACDAFHAMTSDRPTGVHRLRAALEELKRNAHAQFCPRTTEALLSAIDRSSMVA